MRAGEGEQGLPRHLPPASDIDGEMAKLPRAIAIVGFAGAPMLVLAGLARLHVVEAADVPAWLVLATLALAVFGYFSAMAHATGQRVAAVLLALGLPLVLYYFSSYGGPGLVIAPFALITIWIVSIIAAVSFANLGGSQ
jgi:hypothetical protein